MEHLSYVHGGLIAIHEGHVGVHQYKVEAARVIFHKMESLYTVESSNTEVFYVDVANMLQEDF
jgi:hypothetical protein